MYNGISILVFYFGHDVHLMGSQFPEQGLNLCPSQQKHKVLNTVSQVTSILSGLIAAMIVWYLCHMFS